MAKTTPTNWHRLFGLLLSDFFTGSPFVVEIEKDLSAKKQLLDVVVLRKHEGRFDALLPDGLDELARFNLITFKSHCEALDDWALKELTGHYVNYRKQIGESRTLLPEGDFRLYAVCSRFPQKLADAVDLQRLQDGVYDCRRGTDAIRVIVAQQLAKTENNAMLHLLSASADQLKYGVEHYRQHSEKTSQVLTQLFTGFEREGITMSYTMEDFTRDFKREFIADLTPEERLRGLSPEKILAALPREAIEAFLKRKKGNPSATPRRKRKSG